jgi:hypothetical protein
VYLKVSPIRGLCRLKVKGKLSPQFIGPFKILERVGEVAYRLDLPVQLADVHDVFDTLDDLNVKVDLTIVEHPILILDTMTRVTRNSMIKMCKVQWSNHA